MVLDHLTKEVKIKGYSGNHESIIFSPWFLVFVTILFVIIFCYFCLYLLRDSSLVNCWCGACAFFALTWGTIYSCLIGCWFHISQCIYFYFKPTGNQITLPAVLSFLYKPEQRPAEGRMDGRAHKRSDFCETR